MSDNEVLHRLLTARIERCGISKTAAAATIAADMGVTMRLVWKWLSGKTPPSNSSLRLVEILLHLESGKGLTLAGLRKLSH